MLIICPKCFAQYEVPGVLDTRKNQEFHCSNCNHYFVADDVSETADPDSILDTPAVQPLSGIYPNPVDAMDEPEVFKVPKYLEELPREEPQAFNPDLGYIPEEFKPVPAPKKKKGSIFIVIVYLILIGIVAYMAFLNRELIWKQFNTVLSENGLPTLAKPVVVVPETQPVVEVPVVEEQVPVTVPSPVLGEAPVVQPEQPIVDTAPVESVPEVVTPTPAVVQQKPINPVALAMAERLAVDVAASSQTAAEPEAVKPVMDIAALKEILKIQDISYQLGPNEEGVQRLLIQGNLVNTDLTEVQSPELTAVVYDKQDMVVARKHIVPSQKTVQGNTKEQFYTSIIPAPESVGRVEVNFEE